MIPDLDEKVEKKFSDEKLDILNLIVAVWQHRYNYYVLGEPRISDEEFDNMMYLLDKKIVISHLKNDVDEDFKTSPSYKKGYDFDRHKEALETLERYLEKYA